LFAFLVSPMRTTFLAHFTVFHLIILIILCVKYKYGAPCSLELIHRSKYLHQTEWLWPRRTLSL
jgi:hypothetical protein